MTSAQPVPLGGVDQPCPHSCGHPLSTHSALLGCWVCDCTHGRPRFRLGRLFATEAATRLLAHHHTDPAALLRRHQAGDWGNVEPTETELNDLALTEGGLLHSIYQLDPDAQVWVITEAQRHITTVLLPEEY